MLALPVTPDSLNLKVLIMARGVGSYVLGLATLVKIRPLTSISAVIISRLLGLCIATALHR